MPTPKASVAGPYGHGAAILKKESRVVGSRNRESGEHEAVAEAVDPGATDLLTLRIEPAINVHNVDKFRRFPDPLLEIHATAGPDLVSYDERGHPLRHGAIGPIGC
ncbi:MAG: hypothetical protein IPH81_11730 [Candidatus Microthrix sp.]|nr:hypothetical protein [Candidatus Microthrix sp.]MBP9066034.1 hypothetical protein [Candidatus Microthrix sp.]